MAYYYYSLIKYNHDFIHRNTLITAIKGTILDENTFYYYTFLYIYDRTTIVQNKIHM